MLFDKEIEFYEFCKQRLRRQVEEVRGLERREFTVEEMEPFSSEFEGEDYVLL